jgi:hypothetical protein
MLEGVGFVSEGWGRKTPFIGTVPGATAELVSIRRDVALWVLSF